MSRSPLSRADDGALPAAGTEQLEQNRWFITAPAEFAPLAQWPGVGAASLLEPENCYNAAKDRSTRAEYVARGLRGRAGYWEWGEGAGPLHRGLGPGRGRSSSRRS